MNGVGVEPEVQKLADTGVIRFIIHQDELLEIGCHLTQVLAHCFGRRIHKAFHPVGAQPRVGEESGHVVVAEDEPLFKRFVVKDGTIFPEVFQVGEWIIQLLRVIEKKTRAFS